MKNSFRVMVIIFLLFYSAACVGASRPISATSEPEETDSSIIKSTAAPTFTATFTPDPQVSPSIASTLTSTVNGAVEKKCLQILPELPKDKNYSGQIVLAYPYALYDLRSGEKYEIPNKMDMPSNISVSPDRTMYAYEYREAKQLVIATSTHKIKRIVAIPDHWHLKRWQNDKNLLFVIYEPDPEPRWDNYPPTLGILNPFTGKKQILHPDFPDIDKLNPILSFDGSGITVYDPTLSRVVYERGDWNVILWDIPNKKQLAQLPFKGLSETDPKWLPDGSKFIMLAQDGYFYLVTRDGAITKVSSANMAAEDFSWSPDNRHLAFWRVSLNLKDQTLHLLDTSTGQMSDLCITIGYNPSSGPGPIAPIPVWSPDGSSMVVKANFDENTQSSKLLLLDFNDNTAVEIGENTSPIEWLPVGWITEP